MCDILGMGDETDSGLSVTAHSIIRLENPGRAIEGSIRFRGMESTTGDEPTILNDTHRARPPTGNYRWGKP